MESTSAVIVGGGLAGLAAAVALAPRVKKVTLLESRPRLGGRASSFLDRTTGTTIDNCQHVSLGCCPNWLKFWEIVGCEDAFRWEESLHFVGPSGRAEKFAAWPAPAPFHLFPAFSSLSYLSWYDKRKLSKGLRVLAQTSEEAAAQDPRSFAKWLEDHGQSPTAIARFWHVVLVSALSETLDRIAVVHARKVFVDAFLATKEGWRVQLPLVPLDELYSERLASWLTEQGVEIHLQTGAREVVVEADQVQGVVLRNGILLPAEQVILAVPQTIAGSFFDESVAKSIGSNAWDAFETAPISSVHLWFDRPLTSLPHAVFVDRLSQWVFNRTAIHGPNSENSHYYQVVISASAHLKSRTQGDVIEEVRQELASVWPIADEARLMHARLVTEHHAVLSMVPGIEARRPVQSTPISGLHLAGDWTKTGWPSTMEGAVRSGFLAAESLLKSIDQPESLLVPDARPAWLSRWLFGL